MRLITSASFLTQANWKSKSRKSSAGKRLAGLSSSLSLRSSFSVFASTETGSPKGSINEIAQP
eukprot:m.708667 g.708667  ORF g.708667 m.708667 type:complete len:63 (+) comp58746_c0_seq23:99-287(+)